MKLLILLLALGFAQDVYKTGGSYQNADRDQAAAACSTLDGSYALCSSAQLFQVVYSDHNGFSIPDLCYSGHTSDTSGDYQRGWFMADPNACGSQTGWRGWAPSSGWGAHCCLPEVPGITPQTCGTHTCPDGQIPFDGGSGIFCPTGTCDDTQCCKEWEPAARYKQVGGYEHSSWQLALSACQVAHEDYVLCNKHQIEALAADGVQMCSSAWHLDSHDDATGDVYRRGWYVGEEWAASGGCGGNGGWRYWGPAENMGAAHCCTPSYHIPAYGTMGDKSAANFVQLGIDYCTSQTYTPNVCTNEQVHQVSELENTAICTAGLAFDTLDDQAAGASGNTVLGWWQGAENRCGNTGWRGWSPSNPSVHCCATYLPEYVYEVLEWDHLPGHTYNGGYANKNLGLAACQSRGYDGLCTLEQVVWIGTEEKTDLCLVGWVSNYDTAGYYRTDPNGCGQADVWNDQWQPATPVAFCCQSTTPELELAPAVLDPYIPPTWDYQYTNSADAEAACTGEYSLCTQEQLWTVAYVGVARDDGTVQQANSICRYGWLKNDIRGWYQVDEGACGATGWRTLNALNAHAHCCLDFETVNQEPTAPPTSPPPDAFVQGSSGYTIANLEDARKVCTDLHEDMSLCSAAQIIEVAKNGAAADGVHGAVDPQTAICHSAWFETDRATCTSDPSIHGWYRVDSGCGGPETFKTWHTTDADGNPLAGAFCCSPNVPEYSDAETVIGCVEEETTTTTTTTTITTTTPTTTTTTTTASPGLLTEIPDDVVAALGIDTSLLRTLGNEYYFFDGNNFVETCVGYGLENTPCDNRAVVCAGVLKIEYGSYESQATLVQEALANDDNKHSRCPPKDCVASNIYDPEGFESVVDYCLYDGCYYMNGMETCVCTSDTAATELQTLWEDVFELSKCQDKRPFDEVMQDQLFITDKMIDDLEDQINNIPDINQQLSDAEDDLNQIWTNWHIEISAILQAASTDATTSGNDDVAQSLEQVITDLNNLNNNN